jgi:hypothetical protein
MTEMVDALADTIREAVEQWLARNGGGMVTAYAMAVNYYDADGEQCWATAHAEQQTPAHTLGLLRWHTMSVEHEVQGYFDEEGR